MATKILDDTTAELEKLMKTDKRVSMVLTTRNGHKLRATGTGNKSVRIKDAEHPNGNVVVVSGELPKAISWGDVIDVVVGGASAILDKLNKSQNCTPVTEQTITTNKDGTVTVKTITRMDCRPA